MREFLGALYFCQLWILGFAEMAQPLHTSTEGDPSGPLTWSDLEERAFIDLKQALINAPDLTLPNLAKAFQSHVAMSHEIAKGALILQ